MFPTSTAAPPTFEGFMAANHLAHDHPNLAGWRMVWQNELEVQATIPAVIPPCPDWCTLPAGHEYTSYDRPDDGVRRTAGEHSRAMTHIRHHIGLASEHVQVAETERNTDGAVTVDAPVAFVNIEDDLDAAAVRAFAAELLAAAEAIEAIEAATA